MSGSNRPALEPHEKGYYSDILNQNYKKTIERGPDVLQNLQVPLFIVYSSEYVYISSAQNSIPKI